MKTTARGIAGLLAKGGRIRLICDHKVTPETHAAIVAGWQQAAAILRQEVAPADLTAVTPDDIAGKQDLDLLTWLVAENRLDIRVAIVPDNAIFHDKIGIIADSDGNYIAFHGSLNEARAGAQENYESFDVFTSWRDPERVADKVEQFETLWDGQSRRAYVIPLLDEYDASTRGGYPACWCWRPSRRAVNGRKNCNASSISASLCWTPVAALCCPNASGWVPRPAPSPKPAATT